MSVNLNISFCLSWVSDCLFVVRVWMQIVWRLYYFTSCILTTTQVLCVNCWQCNIAVSSDAFSMRPPLSAAVFVIDGIVWSHPEQSESGGGIWEGAASSLPTS